MWAVENGITTGKTATSFDPNAVCTRGQIVTFLWRYEKAPIVSSLAKFDDVAANSYCYNAVMWAVENGITNGKTTPPLLPMIPAPAHRQSPSFTASSQSKNQL